MIMTSRKIELHDGLTFHVDQRKLLCVKAQIEGHLMMQVV